MDTPWESLRNDLERLYIIENKTLREVRAEMASVHNFHKSEQQYARQFKKWDFRKKKKNLKPEEWEYIGRRISKRKHKDHKDSDVYLDGVKLPTKRIKQESYRKAFVNTYDTLDSNFALPPTPEGMVICTPGSPGNRPVYSAGIPRCALAHLSWDVSQPWLQFAKLLQAERNRDSTFISPLLRRLPGGENKDLSYPMNENLLKGLGSALSQFRSLEAPKSGIDCSTMLKHLMPEEAEGDIEGFATRLVSSKTSDIDGLALGCFVLSNNLYPKSPESLDFCDSNTTEIYDSHVLQIFQSLGWSSTQHLRYILSSRTPTAEALVDNLLACAIRKGDVGLVERILDSGVSMPRLVRTYDGSTDLPLAIAASIPNNGGLELAMSLIARGADVNERLYDYRSILDYAIEKANESLIEMLLAKNARIGPKSLARAIQSHCSTHILRELLRHTTEPLAMALAASVKYIKFEVTMLLLQNGADVNEFTTTLYRSQPVATTVLGHAIQAGDQSTIEQLLEVCGDANVWEDDLGYDMEIGCLVATVYPGLKRPYVSPLIIAVDQSNITAVHTLLHKGIDIETADYCKFGSLVEHAVENNNLEICEALLRHGARVDRTSALLLAVTERNMAMVNLLVSHGAPINENYATSPETVLATALATGDVPLISALQKAGAFNVGPKVRCIGSREAAMYLQRQGLLTGILDIAGPVILATAISEKDHDVAEWLLDNGVDVNIDFDISDPDSWDMLKPLEAAIESDPSLIPKLLNLGAEVTARDFVHSVAWMSETEENETFAKALFPQFRSTEGRYAVGAAVLLDRDDLLSIFLDGGADPRGFLDLSRHSSLHDKWWEQGNRIIRPQSVLEVSVDCSNAYALRRLLNVCDWGPEPIFSALALAIEVEDQTLVDMLLDSAIVLGQELASPVSIENPLEAAIRMGNMAVARILIEHVNSLVNHPVSFSNQTPLESAVQNGDTELFELLITHGADVNAQHADYYRATALQRAASNGFLWMARRLIDLGTDVNARCAHKFGESALGVAAENGRLDMVHLLLASGALITGPDGDVQYKRAVKLAEFYGHYAISRLLTRSKLEQEGQVIEIEEPEEANLVLSD